MIALMWIDIEIPEPRHTTHVTGRGFGKSGTPPTAGTVSTSLRIDSDPPPGPDLAYHLRREIEARRSLH